MCKTKKSDLVEKLETNFNSPKKKIFGIYDRKMEDFVSCVLLSETEIDDYFTTVVNDVTSPFYNRTSDFVVYMMYEVDGLESCDVLYRELSSFIDSNVRNLQVITKTLNFLPNGYFKMPKEMQDDIQNQIKDCVYQYVRDYLDDSSKIAVNSALSKEN